MTIYTLFSDSALIALLILLGQFIRAKVVFLQRFYIPAALIGGLIGFTLGPSCLKVLPFSEYVSSYAGLLAILIFASLPLGKKPQPIKKMGENVGNMLIFVELCSFAQYGIGMILGLFLLGPIFGVPDMFGMLLPAGFLGGPGIGATIGGLFESYGLEEGASLGLISGTVGTVVGIVLGVACINVGIRKGHTRFVSKFRDMDREEQTGLIVAEHAEPMGKNTVAKSVVDPLMFHLALVLAVAGTAYFFTGWVSSLNSNISLPTYSIAVIFGYLINFLFNKTGVNKYVDGNLTGRIGGTCTDLLVAFGLVSIQPAALVQFWQPLAILLFFGGIVFSFFLVFVMGPRMFKTNWFEKSMFSFGWLTGITATGMTLLRIMDPDNESGCIEDFAMAGIVTGIIDAAVVAVAPLAVCLGGAYQFTGICVAVCLLLLIVARSLKWYYPHGAVRSRTEVSED